MSQNPPEKTAQPTKERRKLERFDLHLDATIEAFPKRNDMSPMILNLVTDNISAQGAFFKTMDSLEKGTRVKVDMNNATESPKASAFKRALIQLRGTVLRIDSTGMAVIFDKHYKLSPASYF